MTSAKILLGTAVIALCGAGTPQVAWAQNDALQVLQDGLAKLQRDMAEKQAVREAEGRIDRGESTLEEEKDRLQRSAQQAAIIDGALIDMKVQMERQKAIREAQQQQRAEQQALAQQQANEAPLRYNAELLQRVQEGNAERQRILAQKGQGQNATTTNTQKGICDNPSNVGRC